MAVSTLPGTGDLAVIVGGLERVEAQIRALEGEKRLLLAQAMEHAQERLTARGDARQISREMDVRAVAAEIGIALHVSDRTVQRHMDDALTLLERFPRTLSYVMTGLIGTAHAAAILDAGVVITDDAERAAFERVVLDRAVDDVPARVRAFARELAARLHPESISVRHERAEGFRRVSVVEVDDGMAELRILMSAAKAHAVYDRLTQQGRATQAAVRTAPAAPAPDDDHDGPGVVDTRTIDQIRVDVATDILLTGAPTIDPTDGDGDLGAIRARIEVTMTLDDLAGTGDRGAAIIGGAPIDSATARRLAAQAPGFDRVVLDPVTGTVHGVDRYRLNRQMRRFLAARDRHCRFPGCRQPTRRCQIDHNHEHHDGGPTEICNLCHFCVRHHTLKTETDFTVAQSRDGTLVITTPLGRTTTEKPPPRVVFAPDDTPAPF